MGCSRRRTWDPGRRRPTADPARGARSAEHHQVATEHATATDYHDTDNQREEHGESAKTVGDNRVRQKQSLKKSTAATTLCTANHQHDDRSDANHRPPQAHHEARNPRQARRSAPQQQQEQLHEPHKQRTSQQEQHQEETRASHGAKTKMPARRRVWRPKNTTEVAATDHGSIVDGELPCKQLQHPQDNVSNSKAEARHKRGARNRKQTATASTEGIQNGKADDEPIRKLLSHQGSSDDADSAGRGLRRPDITTAPEAATPDAETDSEPVGMDGHGRRGTGKVITRHNVRCPHTETISSCQTTVPATLIRQPAPDLIQVQDGDSKSHTMSDSRRRVWLPKLSSRAQVTANRLDGSDYPPARAHHLGRRSTLCKTDVAAGSIATQTIASHVGADVPVLDGHVGDMQLSGLPKLTAAQALANPADKVALNNEQDQAKARQPADQPDETPDTTHEEHQAKARQPADPQHPFPLQPVASPTGERGPVLSLSPTKQLEAGLLPPCVQHGAVTAVPDTPTATTLCPRLIAYVLSVILATTIVWMPHQPAGVVDYTGSEPHAHARKDSAHVYAILPPPTPNSTVPRRLQWDPGKWYTCRLCVPLRRSYPEPATVPCRLFPCNIYGSHIRP